MKQKIPQPPFGEDETAPFKHDSLNRAKEIKDLTPMITKIETPATIALDAEWGAGKTAFIKMWKAHLNNEASARAFYFNAWETDFAADPLAPFMAAIAKQLPEPDDSTELVEKAKTLIPVLIGDVVRKVVGKGTAQVAEEAMEHLLVHNDKTTEFKDALKDFAAAQKGERIVIFVDELDRCRPDYAVKVLERIKHLFDVPEVVFVLATNREQLCHSINALYGAKFDADAYLRRFIEFDYKIKQPDVGNYVLTRFKDLGIDKFLSGRTHPVFQRDRENLREALMLLVKVYGSPLRDIEQLLMRVVLVLWSLEDHAKTEYHFFPVLLAFLVLVRLKAPENYRQYISAANNWEEMAAYWHKQLKSAGIFKRQDDGRSYTSTAADIAAHIIVAKGDVKDNAVMSYKVMAGNAFDDAEEMDYLNTLGVYIQDIQRDTRSRVNLRYLVKKIEMLDQFRFPDDNNAEGNN